jgi:ribosome-associated protein
MQDNDDTTIRKGFPMPTPFAVRGEYIQLDQLLKATGLADSGGAAHAAISEGLVSVDGAVELRKRAKLRPGQRVAFAGEVVELVGE